MNVHLTQQLREGRLSKGLKQSDVTELTGIKNTTLSNYENGNTEPDMDTFLQLCELYGLDYAEILGEAYGYHVSGNDFDIKKSEIDYIKKYRILDDHGRDMVDTVLQKEFDRCETVTNVIKLEQTHLEPKAAHERTDIEVTEEMRKHDDDIMNNDDFWK